jgi:hypothetical protein
MRKEVEICQQARIVRGTGGAVCPVRDQVQEHNHDLKRRGEVLGRQPCLLPIAAPVILEAIGPDEQEPVNELEALLLRLRMIVAGCRASGARNDAYCISATGKSRSPKPT